MRTLFKKSLFTFSLFLSLLTSVQLFGQTKENWNPALNPGGANSMVFKFTKQVWLNPTIILLKQNFEQSTQVKLLLLPRLNGKDTTGSSKLEKAFDKVLSLLVYQENVQGSIKFYFDPQNPAKPFTFATSEELHCKFTDTQKDTVEQLLNKQLSSATNLNDFTAIPFDSIITQASRYCKRILQNNPAACGPNPAYEFTLKNINSTPAKLNFERLTNSVVSPNGDVDVKKYPQLAQYYNSATDLADNSTYDIAWKAMIAGRNDIIKLKIKKKLPDFESKVVVFKNTSGTETYNTTFNPIDSSLNISISGKPAGTMAEVIGYYTPTYPGAKPYAIGAFNVQFYQEKPTTVNVVLVDLGGAKMPSVKDVQDELAKVYGGVFVNFKVTIASTGALPSNINKNIHIEKSSLLSNYMPDMKPIISQFKNSSAFKSTDKNTYYFLYGCSNDGNYLGYMPRARNIGFMFDNNPHTLAHELGHGAFNLKHIFSSDELGEGNREQTDNLMDYAPSTGSATKPQDALYKHQWDYIHDPSFVGWFEGDDAEGALAKRTWFTPDWKAFTLGDETRTINTDASKFKINQGTVPGIVYKEIKYTAVFENNIFKGYFTPAKTEPLTLNYLTLNDDSYCSLFFNYGCEKSKYYTTTFGYVNKKRKINKEDFIIEADFKQNITKDSGLVACNITPPKNTTFVINKSHIDYQSKNLEILLNGGKEFSEADQTYQRTLAKLYLTSFQSTQEEYDEVAKASQQKGDTLRLWLHYTVDSVWIIKKGIQQDAFDKVLASYNLKPSQQFDAIISEAGVGIEQLASALYSIGDWVTNVDSLKMPEAWWNCSNALVYNPPLLVKVMTIALAPVGAAMDPIIKRVAPNLLKENESADKITFALYAGLWDGMIGFVGGVGDGAKMAFMSFATNNAKAVTATANMSKLISDNGGGIGGFGNVMWDGIKSGFDLDKPCVLSHTVGEFSFTIVLAVFTAGESAASTVVGRAILKSVAVLDKLDIVSKAISTTAGCVLKVSYKASRPVFRVLYNGAKVIPEFFKVPATGMMYSFIIPLPQVNIKGGVKAFKEAIAKGEVKIESIIDKEGKAILDEEDNALVRAVTKEGEEVHLVEKAIIESSLVSSLPPYLRALHDRLKNADVLSFEQGDVIKYVTKDGNEFAKIEGGVFNVTMEKGKIPEPLKYLDGKYIADHISKFKREGGSFIVVKSWIENGKFSTLAPRKFVGLKSEMDAVIAKYKAAGNDWRILRDELNLGTDVDLSVDEIFYISIDGSDSRFSFDMPNGNEYGAIIGEWVPAGYTKNGIAETALKGSEGITHNKNVTTLLNNFPDRWEKIK